MESIANTITAEIGELIAADVTPQEMGRWLDRHCKTEATFNRYRASLSAAYQDGILNGRILVTVPASSTLSRSPMAVSGFSPERRYSLPAQFLHSQKKAYYLQLNQFDKKIQSPAQDDTLWVAKTLR